MTNTMAKYTFTAALMFVMLTSSSASAQSEPSPSGVAETKTLSVTISPFHLVSGIFEAGLEYAITPRDSAMIIGGYGVQQSALDDETNLEIPTILLGAQYRRYVLGDFDAGLHVGAEFSYINASASTEFDGITVEADATGIAPGVFVGGKHTFDFGLTSELQVGGLYYLFFGRAEASAGETTVEETDQSPGEFGLLVNLNLGWTF